MVDSESVGTVPLEEVLGSGKDLDPDFSSVLDQIVKGNHPFDILGDPFISDTIRGENESDGQHPPPLRVLNRTTQQWVSFVLQPHVQERLADWMERRRSKDFGALALHAMTWKGDQIEVLVPRPPEDATLCMPASAHPQFAHPPAPKRGPYKCGRCRELKGRNHKNVCIFVKQIQANQKKKPAVKKNTRKGRPRTYACGCGYYKKKDPEHKTNCPVSRGKWVLRSEASEGGGEEVASPQPPTVGASNSLETICAV